MTRRASMSRCASKLTKDPSVGQDVQIIVGASPRQRNRFINATHGIERKRSISKSRTRKPALSTWPRKSLLSVFVIMCFLLCYALVGLFQRIYASTSGSFSSVLVSQAFEAASEEAEEGGFARKAPPIITIDRSILERLEYLHRASGDLDELDVLTWNGRWPPLVTQLPEPKLSSKTTPSYADVVDLCGPKSTPQSACRFLLPYRIAEQESKARLHLSQLAYLAQALNRTLVLPNVGKSRMGICFGWDFSMYYDLSGLIENGIRFARLETLKAWTDLRASRRISTTGQLLILAEKTGPITELDPRFPVDFEVQSIKMDDIDTGCFRSRFQNLNMTDYGAVSLSVINPRKTLTAESGQKLVNAVENVTKAPKLIVTNIDKAVPVLDGPDILVLNWDLRHSIFSIIPFDLRYSPQLIDLASELSPPGPYLAVHWRVETILPENLPQCAYALIDTLINILHDPSLAGDIKFIWIASDMPFTPLPNTVARSGTLKELTALHQEAAEIMRAAFETGGVLSNWRLQTLEKVIETRFPSDRHHEEWLDDIGVRGILDKIIASQASLFVSGTTRCSRIR